MIQSCVAKVSTPADAMKRMSMFRGSKPLPQSIMGCPSSRLYDPMVPPAVESVDVLMTEDRTELANRIRRQMGTAEKEIQELRRDEFLEQQAPKTAMEQYFMSILSAIREKEMLEMNNAYLTAQQKDDLERQNLARKGTIDGKFVQKASEKAEEEIAEDQKLEKFATEAVEREAKASAEASASASASTMTPSKRIGILEGASGMTKSLLKDLDEVKPLERTSFVESNTRVLNDEYRKILTKLQDARAITASTSSGYASKFRRAVRERDYEAVKEEIEARGRSVRRALGVATAALPSRLMTP